VTRIQKRKVTQEIFQPRHDAVADFVEQGNTLRQAMLKAGYSEGRANRGIAGVPKVVIEKLARRGLHFAGLAEAYGNEDKRRDLVRGALVSNVLNGKDTATKSLELLGRDTALGMFRNDANMLAVQINIPVGLQSAFSELLSPQGSPQPAKEDA